MVQTATGALGGGETVIKVGKNKKDEPGNSVDSSIKIEKWRLKMSGNVDLETKEVSSIEQLDEITQIREMKLNSPQATLKLELVLPTIETRN